MIEFFEIDFNEFDLVDVIGVGVFGKVYCVWWREEEVVVKVVCIEIY